MYTEIGIREFRAKLREFFIKAQNESVHIRRGGELYELRKCTQENEEVKVKKEIIKALISEYGCGCEKVEKKMLCPKHGRY